MISFLLFVLNYATKVTLFFYMQIKNELFFIPYMKSVANNAYMRSFPGRQSRLHWRLEQPAPLTADFL